jgi:hypothetical protein
MSGQSATNKSDKIGELWAELQKTEERLRTVGGGISTPTMDCFVNDLPKDPFDATVFTALSDADLKSRIGAAQPSVAAMVASVVADIDGKGGGQLSTLFGRGGAQLAPMAIVEGPHSQWTGGGAFASAKPAETAKLSTREKLAQTAADAKRASAERLGSLQSADHASLAQADVPQAAADNKSKRASSARAERLQSSTDALSAGFDSPSDHATPISPKVERGKLMSSSDALHSAIAPAPEPLKIEPGVDPKIFEAAVPEPRAHRDLPSAVRARMDSKIKPIQKKRPLWVRILWG